MEIKCKSCGHVENKITNFCTKCGAKMENSLSTNEATPTPTANKQNPKSHNKAKEGSHTATIIIIILLIIALLLLGGIIAVATGNFPGINNMLGNSKSASESVEDDDEDDEDDDDDEEEDEDDSDEEKEDSEKSDKTDEKEQLDDESFENESNTSDSADIDEATEEEVAEEEITFEPWVIDIPSEYNYIVDYCDSVNSNLEHYRGYPFTGYSCYAQNGAPVKMIVNRGYDNIDYNREYYGSGIFRVKVYNEKDDYDLFYSDGRLMRVIHNGVVYDYACDGWEEFIEIDEFARREESTIRGLIVNQLK